MANACPRLPVILLVCVAWLLPAAASAEEVAPHEVVFKSYSPYASNAELVRRLLTPLTAARALQLSERTGQALRGQPIDLANERFVVYVPAQAPSKGYGVLVFVPPWNYARLPEGWSSVLDQFGIIFVTAARSGNDEGDIDRREPLALLAEQNVAQRYAVDPERIFVSGFSGGSRVALRLALAYPDVFRGAILNAGSDPIGSAGLHVPPKDLFLHFQESSHLVYVTGSRDTTRLAEDAVSRRAMRDWCVFNVDTSTPDADHAVATPTALSEALRTLLAPVQVDRTKLAACRSAIDAELSTQLGQAVSLIAAGRRDDARELLKTIDGRFGGLAAPRSVELDRQVE